MQTLSRRRRSRIVRGSWLVPLLALAVSGPPVATAQDEEVGLVNPEFLEQYALTNRFRSGVPARITITPDERSVLFLRSGPRDRVQDLYELDLATGAAQLLTAAAILQGAEEHLTPEEKARRERTRQTARGIASFKVSKDGRRVLVPMSGRLFVIERSDGTVRELESDAGYPLDARFSPDGNFLSCVRDSEVYVTEIATGTERRLTEGSSDTVTNGLSEFVAQEEMGRHQGYWWTPDSRAILFQQTDVSGLETMYIADAARPERPPQSWRYPRPGKTNATVRLGIVSRDGGTPTWIEWDQETYPYLATVRWKQAKAPPVILVQNRTQTAETLLAVDPASGATTTLLQETDDAWINLDQSMPKWLKDGQSFLWTTERNGAWQLELRARDGGLIHALTRTAFGFRRFVDLDETRGVIYLAGGPNPIETHLYRLPLDAPSSMERMTIAPGLHGASFSENGGVFVHTVSHRDGGRDRTVRRTDDGSALAVIASHAERPRIRPVVEFVTVGRDPVFHAAIMRPRGFKRGIAYPVIVSVYGGPHGQTVQASADRYRLNQWYADQGFVVVQIDNRGTPARGRAWERVIKGNLIDVPLADQVNALEMLGARFPEMDMTRVGVYGWSFGGYFSAMAVMQRPDVYHAGIAGAPVADWLDYDTHYTERYMGLPSENAAGYEASNVLTHTPDLERPLLIIHGTADDNVYFAHSLKMSNALFRAGRDHEFIALSDFTHMVADPVVMHRLYERMVRFFRMNL